MERTPDASALCDPATGESLNYAELWGRAGALAAALASEKVGKGDVVAVDLGRSVELVVALLGILRAGAAYLPIDGHAPADRVEGILAEADVRVVVGGPADSRVPAALRRIAVPAEVREFDDPAVGRDDPAYVMYTSGSTGLPKGVIVPHRAVMRLVTNAKFCTIEPGERCANCSNPAFDATTFEIWNPLTAGGAVVVFPSVTDLTIDDWVDLVRAERVDAMFLTTSLFHTVARERPEAFASLSTLVVGGEQLELTAVAKVLAAEPPRRLVNGYGPTETTTFAAYYDCTTESLDGLDRIPVGFPLQDTTLHVLDAELKPVPQGETGELCVGGPGVALGYLNRPELTAERFVAEPATGARLYRTGDLARQLAGGAYELLGRRDRQVKLRGFRIELEEIEQALMASDACDSAFVEKVGEGPAALLVGFVLPAKTARGTDFGALLAATLPGYMIPARWVELASVPFGPTGKVDRNQLLGLLAQPSTTDASEDQDPFVAAIGSIWQDVLGVASVPGTANFLDLGGNSIMAMQLASRIRERLDLPVEPVDILLAPSLVELAAQLREAASVAR